MSGGEELFERKEKYDAEKKKRKRAEKQAMDMAVQLRRLEAAYNQSRMNEESLRETLESQKTSFGRNQRKKINFDGYDHANNSTSQRNAA